MGKDTVGPPPQKTVEDYKYSVSKLILSLVPYAGGAISEAFNMALDAPYERRQQEWLAELAERFDGVVAKVNAQSAEKFIESLKDNDLFISILAKALRNRTPLGSGPSLLPFEGETLGSPMVLGSHLGF